MERELPGHHSETGTSPGATLSKNSTRLAVPGACLAFHFVVGAGALLAYRFSGSFSALAAAYLLFLGTFTIAVVVFMGSLRDDDSREKRTSPADVFGRVGQNVWLLVTGCALAFLSFRTSMGFKVSQHFDIKQGVVFGAICFVVAFGAFVLTKLVRSRSRDELPEAEALAEWSLNAQWVMIITGISVISLSWNKTSIALWATRLVLFWTLALCMETVFRSFAAFFGPGREEKHKERPHVQLLLLAWLFSQKNPVSEVARILGDTFKVDLRSSWVAGVVTKVFLPILALLAFALWAMTSVVAIQPEEQGIKERFGKPHPEPLEAGMHIKWPWPIETVHKYPVHTIRRMTIGYESPALRQDFIWTRPHGEKEYRFLIGEGQELISLDAVILYRIKNVMEYAFQVQNPLDALEVSAYRVMTLESVALTLDELLTKDRGQFSRRIRQKLQEELDKQKLGIELIEVCLMSIHPPLEVAAAYQKVISSHLIKEKEVLRGQKYKVSTLPSAMARAKSLVDSARAEALVRVGRSKGESDGFRVMEAVYSMGRSLFKSRRRIEVTEKALAKRELVVIDDRLFQGEIESWLDMRGMRGIEESLHPDHGHETE
ncbi:protease modulator HflK [candidate division TA06 bacterium]|uniref:Protease modulator HflK n=1 Tax=candidate division TA06 bacterium TaxID=2250710 RepID=A0A523XI65_UNCT6|nr:MAG: protease modulator HflK [candidate division TA06 bacterium]